MEKLGFVTNHKNAELWHAARLHLGAFGLMTKVKLQLRDAYRLKEQANQIPLNEVMGIIDKSIATHRHFEFFWHPQEDLAHVKMIDETIKPAQYPMADEGSRCGWSYEVLPNHRPHRHTEMEYSIPLEAGPACMNDIGELLRTEFTDVRWPVEYRTLKADDVWLFTAYRRDTVTISVHQDIRQDDELYFRACEDIFRAYDGRPHWGKVNYLNGDQLSAIHPKWHDWWQIRQQADPQGTFLNEYMYAIAPTS